MMSGPTLIGLFLVVAVVGAALAAPPDKKCTEPDKQCKESSECCAGCCTDNKCDLSADCVTAANNPCYLHACPPGKVCYLAKVECLQSPCQPIPACRADDSDYE